MSLWASDSLVGDPVALDMDDSKTVWITATNRRRSSAPDIRNHPDWQLASLKMQDGEDRRAFLRREPAPEYNEQNSSWLTDYNDDGVHDWRDLTVQEEEIYRIDNTTGSGHANRTQLFYRGFQRRSLRGCWRLPSRADEVFVGVAPDLWRIRDTRGDSIATGPKPSATATASTSG